MSFIEVLPDYIQAFAILAAGVWAYWTFFRQRSNEPATDINVDANFVGAQAGWVVVEVMATLENKSLVRHEYRDFRVNVRYLMPSDELVDGDDTLFHQLRFPHTIDERIADGRASSPTPSTSTPASDSSTATRPLSRARLRSSAFTEVHTRHDPRGTISSMAAEPPPRATSIDSQRVFALPDEVRCTATDHTGGPAFLRR